MISFWLKQVKTDIVNAKKKDTSKVHVFPSSSQDTDNECKNAISKPTKKRKRKKQRQSIQFSQRDFSHQKHHRQHSGSRHLGIQFTNFWWGEGLETLQFTDAKLASAIKYSWTLEHRQKQIMACTNVINSASFSALIDDLERSPVL